MANEYSLEILIAIAGFLAIAIGLGRVRGTRQGKAILKKAKEMLTKQQDEVMTDAREELLKRLQKIEYARKHRRDLTARQRAAMLIESTELRKRLDKIRADTK